jgi:amino acid adenylation domain-containing protein
LLESEETRAGREYWRKQGITVTPNSKLPYENSRNNRSGFEPQFITTTIDKPVLDAAGALLRECSASMSALLLACWQVLLFRITSDREFVIGVAYDGRTYEGLGEAIGLFAKYLPVCSRLNPEKKFIDLLDEINKQTCEIREWQDYFSWEKCVNISDAGPTQPFFHFGYDFYEQPAEFHASGVSFSIERQYVCIDRFKLRLCCLYSPLGLSAQLHFDISLFNPNDIARLASRFLTLLLNVINNPDSPIAKIDILPDDERPLLRDFNQTRRTYSLDTCIHHLVQQQALRTPHLQAIRFERDSLSYQQLSLLSNQLARYLLSLGAGPESVVGICMHRSLSLVTALLATLKAGAAYLPLDPTYPQDRLSYMAADSGLKLILSEGGLAQQHQYGGVRIVDLTAEQEAISQESTDPVESEVRAENLAYVIYTSGSTGKPKGVMISHRGLMNYLRWIVEAYEIEKGEGAPLHSPIGFDLTITGLFGPLMAGRRVDIVSEEEGVEGLARSLKERRGYSLVKLTPAHMEMLRGLLGEEISGEMARAMIIGGEALYWEDLRTWREKAPETRLINEYGPTEAVVGCSIYDARESKAAERSVPIGRPINNVELYVLDRAARLTPIGVVGELYIGGVSQARGYIGRPDQTAEKFVPDGVSGGAGKRLYRTGDLCRWRADGNLEYLGRVDDQVKVRGYRIELGEIESVLKEHEAVKECAVIVSQRVSDKKLVAYVSFNDGDKLDGAALQDYLRERLPEYMTPSTFVTLDALPVTAKRQLF